jgi:hypothetical protein
MGSPQVLLDDSFEKLQIDIAPADDGDHFLSFESLFSFQEPSNA